ncbi:MAG: hypothetical protein N3A68_02290 [Bacteroidia bacterium]|nr:hypothetical protein [Bacteroidia bacterium]GIV23237.1 MAG: hypothetical protein KatS3mg025_0896 [Bacteroidia bacterium]
MSEVFFGCLPPTHRYSYLRKLWSWLSLSLCLSLSCRSKGEGRTPTPEWLMTRQRLPLYEAAAYTAVWRDTSEHLYHLRATHVSRERRGDTLVWHMSHGVWLTHIGPEGDTLERLFSQEADFFPEKGLFYARYAVQVSTHEGLFLETDLLWWDREKALLVAPGWVRLRTPKEMLRGEGLEYHTQRRTYRLRRTQGRVQSPLS